MLATDGEQTNLYTPMKFSRRKHLRGEKPDDLLTGNFHAVVPKRSNDHRASARRPYFECHELSAPFSPDMGVLGKDDQSRHFYGALNVVTTTLFPRYVTRCRGDYRPIRNAVSTNATRLRIDDIMLKVPDKKNASRRTGDMAS